MLGLDSRVVHATEGNNTTLKPSVFGKQICIEAEQTVTLSCLLVSTLCQLGTGWLIMLTLCNYHDGTQVLAVTCFSPHTTLPRANTCTVSCVSAATRDNLCGVRWAAYAARSHSVPAAPLQCIIWLHITPNQMHAYAARAIEAWCLSRLWCTVHDAGDHQGTYGLLSGKGYGDCAPYNPIPVHKQMLLPLPCSSGSLRPYRTGFSPGRNSLVLCSIMQGKISLATVHPRCKCPVHISTLPT